MIADLLPEIETETLRHWQHFVPGNGTSPGNGAASMPVSAEWDRALDELQAIGRLENDWDGFGAPAPTSDLMESAVRLASLLRDQGVEAPSRIVPGLTGTILLEWQDGSTYCEIEIDRPYRAELLILVPGQAPTHRVLGGE